MTRLFVYGTLKRGCSNHALLKGQRLVGQARTGVGYALYELEGYPGLVRTGGRGERVSGEVWEVDDDRLARLDEFEGTGEGLYRRDAVILDAPFDRDRVEAYFYLRSLEGRRKLSGDWVG